MVGQETKTLRTTSTVNPVTKAILQKRGLNEGQIHEFLSWDLRKLPPLGLMKDMDRAAERIVLGIGCSEKIAIFGDYDVDGTTSCALFYHFFSMVGVEVDLIQPSRFVEGYGIHPEHVVRAKKAGIDLMITVDCGITGHEACQTALREKIDLIVTDHHADTSASTPKAYAVVNPNRRDEPKDSPLKTLAGVGVAFALCLRVRELLAQEGSKISSLYPLLQFVAIGTICDLVPLAPMNLKLVRHGLKMMPKTTFPGIRAFFRPEERERGEVFGEKVSFDIGPLLNSKGRLDHPERALKLLIARDNEEAYHHYAHLKECNFIRKTHQAKVFQEAREDVVSRIIREEHLISIAYGPSWHEGVIGIVASKLTETFKVPAIVFTESSEEDILKGSARSVGGYDIFKALERCSDLFTKFGGHPFAAGLSMPKANFLPFKERMEVILSETAAIERTAKPRHQDLEIWARQIQPSLIRSLELLGPFGPKNPRPLFKIMGMKLHSYDILKDIHVRWSFKAEVSGRTIYYRGISFNYMTIWEKSHPEDILKNRDDPDFSVYATIEMNFFKGQQFVRLHVDRIGTGLT